MALIVYATITDLQAWLGAEPPANAQVLLRSASIRVALACMLDPYTEPAEGSVDVLRDAACAQAAAWVAAGVNPAAGGLDASVKVESKIGTGSVKFDTVTAQDVAAAVNTLAPEARELLTAAGLLWQPAPAGADPSDGMYDYGLGATVARPLWQYQNL